MPVSPAKMLFPMFPLLLLFLQFPFPAIAQHAIFTESFEDKGNYSVIQGVKGKAIDFGPAAVKRSPVLAKLPSSAGGDYSISVWVNTTADSKEAYDILGCLKKTDNGFDGWKLGVTDQGSWEFIVAKGKNSYIYRTTAPRQSIRDGNWHLLAITYSGNTGEMRFYYDGNQVAIYNTAGLQGAFAGDTLTIGAAIDSKHYLGKGRWQNYWDTYNGAIDEIQLFDQEITAAAIRETWFTITGKKEKKTAHKKTGKLKLFAFNIFHGGHEYGKETGKQNLISMLKQHNADLYTLVETYGSGAEIADALGYHFYLISSNLSIMSRYPVIKTYRHRESFKSGGVQVETPDGKLNVFSVWLDYLPGFTGGGFEKDGRTLEAFLQEEDQRRGNDIRRVLEDIALQLKEVDSIPLLLGGDFNSGSHLDWNEQTKTMHKGYIIPWPVSIALQKAGFTDSYREIHPDPLKHPGLTFSPHYPLWLKERIDFIYYQGRLRATASGVVDTHPAVFPSDHAAVWTEFRFR